MSRRRRVALWSLALVIAVVGDVGFLVYGAAPFGGNMAFEVSLDVAVGFATMAAGIVTWSRRPENRIGPMLFAAGAAWSLSGLYAFGSSYLYAAPGDTHVLTDALLVAGAVLLPLHYAILLHLLLAYPEGVLHARLERALVVGVYGLVVLRTIAILSYPVENALRFLAGFPPFPFMSAAAFSTSAWSRWPRSSSRAPLEVDAHRPSDHAGPGAALLLATVEIVSAAVNLFSRWGPCVGQPLISTNPRVRWLF
jgi:hypothetical protein